MLVEYKLDHVQTALTQVRFLVNIVPHLGKVAKCLLTANIYAGIDQNLCFKDFLVQLFLCLGSEELAGAVRQLDRFGFILILLLGCIFHGGVLLSINAL